MPEKYRDIRPIIQVSKWGLPLDIDKTTNAIININHTHHNIHEGAHYYVKSYDALDTSDVVNFCILTPNTTKWAHLLFSIQSTGETLVEIYEGTSFSADGSLITAVNNNRNSSNTSGLIIRKDPVTIVTGTKISESLFGLSTSPVRNIGGDVRRDDELILKQNTTYIIKITSNSDGNNVDYRANWYEHISVS
jgi:hypothetical protein